jgi:hypothetical protein
VLPDEHQDKNAEFILTTGLLREFPLEFSGIHH